MSVGVATEARVAAWPPGEIDWMFVRGGPEQENRHDVRPSRAGDNFVTVEVRHPGVTLLGIDRRAAVRELTPAQLRSFLQRNVAGGAAKSVPADESLRIRHVSSAKTMVRVAAADGRIVPSPIATSKTGQAVEIRPSFDPTAAVPGSDVPLRVYIDGSAKCGLQVRATCVTSGATTTFITDEGGFGHFRISDAGVWRVEVHHAEPAENDDSADWAIYSATLTFEVAEKGAKR